MWLPCMTSSSGSGTDQTATNNKHKRITAGKGQAIEAQRNKFLSSKKAKTVISHLLEDGIYIYHDIFNIFDILIFSKIS